MTVLRASAPGRICLFGEHQDYLGLPVIAMAVNLRFQIEFKPGPERVFHIQTPDLPGSEEQILDLRSDAPRSAEDFCWGIGQTLREYGLRFETGGLVTFRSGIPIRAGCSSSSAMSAAWMRLLIEIGYSDEKQILLDRPDLAAYLVYLGEKEKFHGAGGMMDQYACYLGGLLHVFPRESPRASGAKPGNLRALAEQIPYGVERLPVVPADFILIDSGVPKDTQGVLSSVGQRAREAIAAMEAGLPGFRLHTTSLAEFDQTAAMHLPGYQIQRQIARDHLINRDLCRMGLAMLKKELSPRDLGAWLNEEHRLLAETLGISTPRIDELQQLCLRAGALGAKINGSGGGGTLFCYAPGAVDAVAVALRAEGVRFFPVQAAPGARLD